MTKEASSAPRTPTNRLTGNTPSPPSKTPPARSYDKGDVPNPILDRYLIERDRQGRPERFYRDHKTAQPAFRDHGRYLTSQNAYPDAVSDMLKVARHRGWSQLKVSGDQAFRREVWVQARSLGMEIKGYRPTERDRQAAAPHERGKSSRRASLTVEQTPPSPDVMTRRLALAAVVVRTLIKDPAAQARLLERAQARATPSREDRQPPERTARARRER